MNWRTTTTVRVFLLFCFLSFFLIFSRVHAQSAVTVTIDFNQEEMVSDFEVGGTYMNGFMNYGSGYPTGAGAIAFANAKALMSNGLTYNNQHIMGFGALNPWPDPGKTPTQEFTTLPTNWGNLDRMMRLMADIGAEPIITLCCAPDWMKVENFDPDTYFPNSQNTDWSILEHAPIYDPGNPAHDKQDEFAFLAAEIAKRYDGTHIDALGRPLPKVTYFQVWNEFKGIAFITNSPGNPWNNNWLAPEYTDLYNKVWDAVKAVRPDAKLGGPYLVVESSGSRHLPGVDQTAWYTANPITNRNKAVIRHWMENKHGADFIDIDRGPIRKDNTPYTDEQVLSLFYWFGDIVKQIKTMRSADGSRLLYNNEPIWFAEDYVNSNGRALGYEKVALASMLYNELKAGTSVSLRWSPEVTGENLGQHLFTKVTSTGGGDPTPNYEVYKNFHDFFGPGTSIKKITYHSESPTPNNPDTGEGVFTYGPYKWSVEVLPSANHVMVINKHNVIQSVNLQRHGGGTLSLTMQPYEVTLLDTSDIPPTISATPTPRPSAPTVTLAQNACVPQEGDNAGSFITFTWANSPRTVTTVEVSTVSNFSTKFYRTVNGSGGTATTTTGPDGFKQNGSPTTLLTIMPNVQYYARLWDGTVTSPNRTFTVPLCSSPTLPGDINDDCMVNVADLSQLLAGFGSSDSVADITGDGMVTIADLSILLSAFGSSCN
ncbi:hypothetical protein HY469_00845 [Candidatus Roizmanbacteria bacterium]|nr:hypothetical protein [Candidatus Roizmanbacteria bacterium]